MSMATTLKEESEAKTRARTAKPVRMVVGITSAQTCLVLTGRLRALRLAGFQVTLVSSPGDLLTRITDAEAVRAKPIAMRRGIAPLADFQAFFSIFFYLVRHRPLIVDFGTPKAGMLGNLAAWMLRIPHRVYTLRGLKLESASGRKRRLLLWAERVSAYCAQVVLCNSASLRREAIALGIAPEAKLRILGDGSSNGVDTDRFCPGRSEVRSRLNIPASDPVVGFVGRLTQDKGVPELLEAFERVLNRFPNCWLLLVGWFDASEDALSVHLRARIADHPRIRHTGFVMDTAEYYRAMDLLILPTHREGFPNVVLEAAASGLPVVTTESTGARDAVIPEVTGLLVPPGYPEAIAEAALELLGNREKRFRMGTAARVWVLERFSNERVLALATEFYKSLLRPKEAARLAANEPK